MQTIKYAKVRAKQDPDYPDSIGIYYGFNLPFTVIDMKRNRRTTRGSVVR